MKRDGANPHSGVEPGEERVAFGGLRPRRETTPRGRRREPLEAQRLPNAAAWGGLRPETKTVKGDALFPRLDS